MTLPVSDALAPKDGDPRGSVALLEERDGTVEVSIERVADDTRAAATPHP